MRNRAKTSKSFLCFAVCAAVFTCASPDPAAFAQAPAPPPPGSIGQASDQLAAHALDLLNNGNLKEAADAYSELLIKFPNSGDIPEAYFRLGYIQYVQGDYQKAVVTLNKIVGPPQGSASPEIKAAGDALIPQVLARQAMKMAPDDPKRKAAFQDAIKQFDAFIQKYPKSPEIESANYGRAMAAFQTQDFDTAVQSLRDNLKLFPGSESILDSEDLLAVILTAQAGDILKAHGDQKTAFGKLDEALRFLAEIINSHRDVALANDAQFQAGEVLFSRGNAESPGDPEQAKKRARDLASAISVYQAVLPKDVMVQKQQERVAALLPRLQQAVMARNQLLKESLQRLQDRENAKLEAMKAAPDQMLNVQLRIAACYFLLGKYDEARVMSRYLQGFAEDDAQKKQLDYYMVLTYASQSVTDKAVEAYNSFQSKYKGDPLGENLPLALGGAFLGAKPSQPDKAISYFDQEGALSQELAGQ